MNLHYSEESAELKFISLVRSTVCLTKVFLVAISFHYVWLLQRLLTISW